jgi:hypothetical protein
MAATRSLDLRPVAAPERVGRLIAAVAALKRGERLEVRRDGEPERAYMALLESGSKFRLAEGGARGLPPGGAASAVRFVGSGGRIGRIRCLLCPGSSGHFGPGFAGHFRPDWVFRLGRNPQY